MAKTLDTGELADLETEDLSFAEFDAIQIEEWFLADPGAPLPASSNEATYKYAHQNPDAWALVSRLPSGLTVSGAQTMMESEAFASEPRAAFRHLAGKHNQKTHGGGAGASTVSLSDEQAADLAGRLKTPDGGFTVDPRSGKDVKAGYTVAMFPERSLEVPAKDVTPKTLKDYTESNKDVLSQEGNMLGGWHDPESGNVWLDVSKVTSSKDEAVELAKKANQIAIFDIAGGASINTGGTGRSAPAGESRAVKRAVARVGDNCPQCQANTDPRAVPVHPGCNCDVVTEEVEMGIEQGSAPRIGGMVNEAVSALLSSSDFRFTDLLRWTGQLLERAEDIEFIAMIAAEDDDSLWLLGTGLLEGLSEVDLEQAPVVREFDGHTAVIAKPGASPDVLRQAFTKITKGGKDG